MVLRCAAMRCSRCAKEIPDGSVFCGLCGAKQITLGQTLVGTAERLHRAQTLLGGPATGDVMGGGRRFAALSAAPRSAPPPDSTPPPASTPPGPADTFAEGVPTGAMAGLLAARSPTPSTPTPSTPTPSTRTPSAKPDLKSTLLGAPALTRAQIDAARLGDATEKAMPALRVTHPLSTRSGPEETTPNQPSIAPSSPPAEAAPSGEAPSEAPSGEAPSGEAPNLEPQAEPEQTTEVPPPKRQVEVRSSTRPAHVEPTQQPSVIVDSTFDREAQRAESAPPQSADTAATTPRVQASGAPAAQPEPEADASAPKASKRGFSETAWFLDALDADALSRAETEDIRDRQDRFAHSAPDLDPDMRRQLSLRTQDQPALRIERADAPARTLPDRSADRPPARRNDAVIGLVLVVIIALGALGWWWFTQ